MPPPPSTKTLAPEESPSPRQAPPPIGIIAAEGEMPRHLAENVAATGRDVFIIALKGIATADFSAFASVDLRVGGFKAILDALDEAGCGDVMLAGKFTRPRLAEAFPDAMASKIALKLMSSGDDAALTMIKEILAEAGISLVDSGLHFKNMRTAPGLMAGPPPDAAAMGCVEKGRAILQSLGRHDIGQAVVIQGQRVLAIEAAEGTDEMVRRCRGLIDPGLGRTVLVKMMKSGQDAALDPPVIGLQTIKQCQEAGIGMIAIEAEAVIITEREATEAAANEAGITLIGVVS